MKKLVKILLSISLLINIAGCKNEIAPAKYEPTFQSLEQVNPVPEWFKDAKFGIYFHWGVYSVPAYGNEWYPRSMYFKGTSENLHQIGTYGEIDKWPYDKFITGAPDKQGNLVQFAPKLKSEGGKFDPAGWAQLFADAGAKFAGPVAEHHDGFSMWASKVNPWNAKDTGPKMDLVKVLTDAIRKKDMKIILSMHHAYNITGFYEAVPPTDDAKLQLLYGQQGKEKNEAYWLNKHKEIIDNYKPDIIWQDFNLHQISQPVLLQFLSYYYNKAGEWNKEVVATYKDALNTKCAVLDFERGGPTDLTENYWLTDDAISSSSWSYTEGIGYYSKKQILHGFFDRVSKNGNLLLNISPKADGTIPQEQKDVLLAMGDWLKKYGEAIYATRAWESYGEGPTKMGAAHGVFTSPAEGTAKDIRYTRSKDNTTLYAILLGWEQGQKEVILNTLSTNRIDCKSLKTVALKNGLTGEYIPLNFKQDTSGLVVTLPERPKEELAYLIKLSFKGFIPKLNKYVEVNSVPFYYLAPTSNTSLVLNINAELASDRKSKTLQWKIEKTGLGIYKIINRENPHKVLECAKNDTSELTVQAGEYTGTHNQQWKIEHSFNDALKITNKQYADYQLTIMNKTTDGTKATLHQDQDSPVQGWKLLEVCEMKQTPYKKLSIPGTIEVEDFDLGCPSDTYYDKDDVNAGGKYRIDAGVDIEVCAAGGYNIGWANTGEWMAYTVNVAKSGNYKASIYVATTSDSGKLHLEFDGKDLTGILPIKNTSGYQNWQAIPTTVNLTAGNHLMKLYLDEANQGLNMDKLVFEIE
ncbi:MAG: alpha-L-fucosidase [Salinivirgaceae bacterium]